MTNIILACLHFLLSISPQTDFYAWAVQEEVDSLEIPAGHSAWGGYHRGDELVNEQLKEILSSLDATASHEEALLQALYLSATDIDQRNEVGITPLLPLLKEINSIKSKSEVHQMIAKLHLMGITPFFEVGPYRNPYQSEKMTCKISPGGLGAKDPKYVSTLLELANIQGNAEAITTMHTSLKNHHLSPVESRQLEATHQQVSFQELQALMPHFPWESYFSCWNITTESLLIENPSFYSILDELLENEPLENVKVALQFVTIHQLARYLSKDFYQYWFCQNKGSLLNEDEFLPLQEQAQSIIDNEFGELLGKIYVKRYFSEEKKEQLEEMISYIKEELICRIDKLLWLTNSSKELAKEKVRTLRVLLGHPSDEGYQEYSSLHLEVGDPLITQVLKIHAYEEADYLQKIGGPFNKEKWYTPAYTSNAYNAGDTIVFPAGALQPPFVYDDEALTWGCLGSVIGHEMIHCFDDQGRKIDPQGNINPWWTLEEEDRFSQLADTLVKQFDSYTLDFSDGTTLPVNGQLTLGENIADLGGLVISYCAFNKYLKSHTLKEQNYSPSQRFFLGWAQFFAIKATEEYQKYLLEYDPHSPGKWRVNGPLSQNPYFWEAYDVPYFSPMHIPYDLQSTMWFTDEEIQWIYGNDEYPNSLLF